MGSRRGVAVVVGELIDAPSSLELLVCEEEIDTAAQICLGFSVFPDFCLGYSPPTHPQKS